MPPDLVILLLSLSASLAAYGVAQWLIDYFDADKNRLSLRLTSDWRADMEALRKRNLTVETDVKGVPPWFGNLPIVRKINRKLISLYPRASLRTFLYVMGSLGATLSLPVGLVMSSLFGAFAAFSFGAYLPILFINHKRNAKQKLLANQLPEALDFLSRILRAGHSLSTAIQMMGEELPQPIGHEFRRCYDQHSLGQPLEDCLRDVAIRVDNNEFAFFITAVLIRRSTGGDLSEVLTNLSITVRGRIRLQQHVKAITSEGRFTGYILVAFPAVLFALSYALNPAYAGVLLRDEMGKLMCGAAILFQFVGLLVIRKIVNIKV